MITLTLNDVHVPAQSPKWQRKVGEFLNKERPPKIILAGDIMDIHSLSTHGKAKSRSRNYEWEFHKELEGGTKFFAWLREMAPKADIQYIIGNHEERLEKYINTRAPLMSIAEFGRWDRILGLEDHNIRVPRKDVFVGCGQGQRCLIRHGHEGRPGLSKFAGGTALKIAENQGVNTFCGHTHKLGVMVSISGGKQVYGAEGGYGGKLNHPYMGYVKGKKLPWVLAFSYFDSEKRANPFPEFVKV